MTKNALFPFVTQELPVWKGDDRIFGVLYAPEDGQPTHPAVILSSGFGSAGDEAAPYAEAFASRGYAAYCFDFRGGSPAGRSSGSTEEMSVFTERDDLEAVLSMIREDIRINPDQVFLMGMSQGAVVSALAAARRPRDVRGLILLYPAFVLVDDAKRMFPSAADIPATYAHMGMTLGRAYAEDLLTFDPYEAVRSYEGPVLIIQGDRDPLVPMSYAEKALRTYARAQLEILPGAGHGFSGKELEKAEDLAAAFMEKNTR